MSKYVIIFTNLGDRKKKKHLASSIIASKSKPPPSLQAKFKAVSAKDKYQEPNPKSRTQNEPKEANNQDHPTHCSYGLVGDDIVI